MAKLMLVEDDPSIQRMYSKMFEHAGFEVVTASDGTFVQETIQIEHPDIIVMDVMMPNFNGLETLQELKSNPATQHIPVVMLSANTDEKLVQQALQLGAARYIAKGSLEPDDMAKAITDILKQ